MKQLKSKSRLKSNQKTILFLLLTLMACTNKKLVVSDIDGNTYTIKNFQGVLWMTENLKTTKDKNGKRINYFTPNNEESTKEQYGLLYDYKTACEICPEGWELPNNEDWEQLINKKQSMVFKDVDYWGEEKVTNENKFSVRPAGYGNNGEHPNNFKEKSIIWSKSGTEEFRWAVIFEKNKNEIRKAEQHPIYGFSVRCIKK